MASLVRLIEHALSSQSSFQHQNGTNDDTETPLFQMPVNARSRVQCSDSVVQVADIVLVSCMEMQSVVMVYL